MNHAFRPLAIERDPKAPLRALALSNITIDHLPLVAEAVHGYEGERREEEEGDGIQTDEIGPAAESGDSERVVSAAAEG